MTAINDLNQSIACRKEGEAEIRRLTYFDPLTGLPNRSLFTEQLQQAIG